MDSDPTGRVFGVNRGGCRGSEMTHHTLTPRETRNHPLGPGISNLGSAGIALLLVVVAASLRFYKLGHWPFAFDEVETLSETRALFDATSASPESQTYRLPRLVPVGYLVSWLGYSLFGADEFGSRVAPALVGAAMVGLVFLLGQTSLGRRAAIMIALLTTLSPAHVFQSQQNRFYAVAAFFAACTLLLGAVAAQRSALAWSVAACGLAVLSLFSHTVNAALFPMVCAGVLAARYVEEGTMRRPVVLVFGITGVILFGLALFHVGPLMHGWNQGAEWGYSVGHAVLASVNLLGWPVFLLAGLGLVLMFGERTRQFWYWLSCVSGWAAATVLLPLVVPYHPWYVFPLALGGLVFAGYAISEVYGRLRPTKPLASVVWVCLALGLNLPAVVSHFVDGSRIDMRVAAHYVRDNWQPDDRVATVRIETFRYYAGCCEPATSLASEREALAALEQLTVRGGRVWVVVGSTRSGLPVDLERWLLGNTTHRLHVQRRRFDYFENTVDVFLFTP